MFFTKFSPYLPASVQHFGGSQRRLAEHTFLLLITIHSCWITQTFKGWELKNHKLASVLAWAASSNLPQPLLCTKSSGSKRSYITVRGRTGKAKKKREICIYAQTCFNMGLSPFPPYMTLPVLQPNRWISLDTGKMDNLFSKGILTFIFLWQNTSHTDPDTQSHGPWSTFQALQLQMCLYIWSTN